MNKNSWDKLTTVQRKAFQAEFAFSTVLKDKMISWNRFYGQDWKNQDLCKEIVGFFGKVDACLSSISIKVA